LRTFRFISPGAPETIPPVLTDNILLRWGRRLAGWCAVVFLPLSCAAAADPPDAGRFVNTGMGGGGALFVPSCSPHDTNLMFVACDMSGVYRSANGGKSWTMLDKRQLRRATTCPVAFHPRDPRIVYACGDGQLKVSRDAGQTWELLVKEPPWGQKTVTQIHVSPALAGTIFVGTSNGAFRSEDAGRTWRPLPDVTGRVLGFVVPPARAGRRPLIIVGTYDGVFRSESGGARFRDLSAELPWRKLRGFCGGIHPKTGRAVLYCTIWSKFLDGRFVGGVWRSMDDGDVWESAMGRGINVTPGKRDPYGMDDLAQYHFIATTHTRPGTVYVTTRGTGYWPPYHWTVYRSDDYGASWRSCFTGDPRFKNRNVNVGWVPVEMSWGFGGPPLGFHVCPATPDVAMYSNKAELFVTHNGARTWQQVHSQGPIPGGAVERGKAWTSCGLEVTSCWHVNFDPHFADRMYVCYTDIGFARSEDRGRTWQLSTKGSPWRNTWYQIALDPRLPGMIYAACSTQHDIPHYSNLVGPRYPGGVCISRDGGANWEESSRGLPQVPATSIVLDPRSPTSARTLYVAMYGRGVFKSTDNGRTWREASNGLDSRDNKHAWSLKLHPDGTLFCSVTGRRADRKFADGSGLYRSRDGGQRWEFIGPAVKWAGDFDFDPRDSRVLYVAVASAPGFSQGGVYKTTDGGARWRQLLAERQLPAELSSFAHGLFVTVHPKRPETVYFSATTHGLFLSEDAGEQWREVRGIPFTSVQRVTFDPKDDNTIWVTTFGGGVWRGPARGVLPQAAFLPAKPAP
jgi:photosystem II stability/assembly factor-like uncharacterized protein